MAETVKQRVRAYVSPWRDEQARRTRAAIVEAAHRLFVERGYRATRVEDVANQAGVAFQTVYSAVGNKRALLSAVLERAAAGDDGPDPVAERFRLAMEGAATPAERLDRVMALGRDVMERSGAAHRILRSAAAAEPGMAEALDDIEDRRRRDAHAIAALVAGDGGLAEGVDAATAGDLLYALTAYEVHDLLVARCGWGPEKVGQHLGRLLAPLFATERTGTGRPAPARRRSASG